MIRTVPVVVRSVVGPVAVLVDPAEVVRQLPSLEHTLRADVVRPFAHSDRPRTERSRATVSPCERGYDSDVRASGIAISVLALSACVRDSEDALCPKISAGGLIVTEVHGPQSPDDPMNGNWIELYNASGSSIDLIGVKVRFRRKDGSTEIPILVRDHVNAAAGSYTVLGLFLNDDTRPMHVDYGFAQDFTEMWLSAAAIDVETCGQLVDRATYDALPKMGSFSLTGAMMPDSNTNDDLRNWCTNSAMVGGVYPGSPKQANPPCP